MWGGVGVGMGVLVWVGVNVGVCDVCGGCVECAEGGCGCEPCICTCRIWFFIAKRPPMMLSMPIVLASLYDYDAD